MPIAGFAATADDDGIWLAVGGVPTATGFSVYRLSACDG